MVLGLTKLENRFVFEPAEILENDKLLESINYEYANKVLKTEIDKTRKWLLDALAAPKKIRFLDITTFLRKTTLAKILKKFLISIKRTIVAKLKKTKLQD